MNDRTRIRWAVGVTTVPKRAIDLLPRTLHSLRAAGFSDVRLFCDGGDLPTRPEFLGYPVTARYPRIGAWGNWLLGLMELWIRHPGCNYYAMFQDDLVCVRGIRQYLETVPTDRNYFNLYTVSQNDELVPDGGWEGFYKSNQLGRGALALIFPQNAVEVLLQDSEVVNKPRHCNRPDTKIDGTVSGAMKRAGFIELVHHPSLTEHTGAESAIGHDIGSAYRSAPSFPGEEYDARILLGKTAI